ncbi:nuclear transport factor 2 family protein [Rhodococcus sp. HNM0569]|uniref:nuclear transport factor 2 family protein n=1 Tax=Rhodococcus sp. HNM0569 TaxID=2716340 RepID=UPI00146F29B0|nr:nuclear transport factor 2 family protein [Rhodococcus sp. HNM0569]NLU84608.1 nuclear transport factor 2 family protein [Rhodococcus sp. HNM0569]
MSLFLESVPVAEQLAWLEEIKAAFALRLRVMDTKQWDRYPEMHTDDVVSETFSSVDGDHSHLPPAERPGAVVGTEALTRAISSFLDGVVTVTSAHHGHTPEITFTSPTTATGIWAMEDNLWWTNGDTEESLRGWGHYHEEYRRVDGRWLISYRNLTRLRVDHTPGFYSYRERNSPA